MTEPELCRCSLETAFAAEQRAARLADLLDEAAEAVHMKDLAGRYLFANRTAARLLGRAPHEVVGRTDAELLPADTAAAIREIERRVLEAGATVVHREAPPLAGVTAPFLSVRGVFRNMYGQITGLFCVTRGADGNREIQDEVISLAAEMETPQEAALMLRPFHLQAAADLLRQRRGRQAS